MCGSERRSLCAVQTALAADQNSATSVRGFHQIKLLGSSRLCNAKQALNANNKDTPSGSLKLSSFSHFFLANSKYRPLRCFFSSPSAAEPPLRLLPVTGAEPAEPSATGHLACGHQWQLYPMPNAQQVHPLYHKDVHCHVPQRHSMHDGAPQHACERRSMRVCADRGMLHTLRTCTIDRGGRMQNVHQILARRSEHNRGHSKRCLIRAPSQ